MELVAYAYLHGDHLPINISGAIDMFSRLSDAGTPSGQTVSRQDLITVILSDVQFKVARGTETTWHLWSEMSPISFCRHLQKGIQFALVLFDVFA